MGPVELPMLRTNDSGIDELARDCPSAGDPREYAKTAGLSGYAARLLAVAAALDACVARLDAGPSTRTEFNGVCLISAGLDAPDAIGALLSRCGLTVWAPDSADASSEDSKYEHALCLVIDMPGRSGLETLELFRRYGIWTPTILIVDNKDEIPPDRLMQTGALDALARPANTRELLRWIECICATQMFLRGKRTLITNTHQRAEPSERFAQRTRNAPQASAVPLARCG